MGIGLEIFDDKGNIISSLGKKRLIRILDEFNIQGSGSKNIETAGLGDITLFFMTRNSQEIPIWTPQNIYLNGNTLIWESAVHTNIVIGAF